MVSAERLSQSLRVSDFQLLLCLLMMTRARKAISITIPTVTLGLGLGAARLLWPQDQEQRDLTALVTRICTQQTDARLTVLEQALRRQDSTMTVWHQALCVWVPSNVRRGAVQC